MKPVACNYYGIRKPRLHPPIINHEFGEQMVKYCLIKILNEDNHETTLKFEQEQHLLTIFFHI